MKNISFQVPAGVETEWTLVETQTRTISVGEGKIRSQHFSTGCERAVRVLEKGGQGILTSTNLESDSSEALFKRALEMARLSPKDPHRHLPVPASTYPPPPEHDSESFAQSTSESVERLCDLEKRILSFDKRIQKVIRIELRQSKQNTFLSNSQSLEKEGTHTSTALLAEIMAGEGPELEVAWDFRSYRFKKDLDIQMVTEGVARLAVDSLGGKSIPSGNYIVLIHPRVGAQLLNLMSEALSAEAVQLGRSFFRDSLGKNVASPFVTIIDDPHLSQGLASAAFDDEGSPTEKVVLLEKGILKNFFYDVRSANKEGRSTNGHGMKSSLGSPPHPHPTNLFLSPGTKTVDDLLASHPTIFYLWDVMGLHMADPITGEFSLGASGFLYQNGEKVHPVRGVTIAGRLLDVLKNISEVGRDLSWMGDRGTPPFLVSHMTVAGN